MKVKDFDIEQTLECGQCFNFEKISDHEYAVVAFGKLLHVRQDSDELTFINSCDRDIEEIWIPYFDLDRDYSVIKKEVIKADERLRSAVEQYHGIRILNQDFPETLISFIISQNKNIPHIKQIIRHISETYGSEIGSIVFQDGTERKYYSFPEISVLQTISEDDFRKMKTGFRAPYLVDAVKKLPELMRAFGSCERSAFSAKKALHKDNCSITAAPGNAQDIKNVNAPNIHNNGINLTYEEAKSLLTQIRGVGDKVAACVLLFSLGYRNAFPVDVWIYRIMEELYRDKIIKTENLKPDCKKLPKEAVERFGCDKFKEFGGYAQQYLFIYARSR